MKICTIFTVILLLAGSVSAVDTKNGLIGYWPLDDKGDSAIAKDISGNGNDGSITGATYVTDGMGGTAIRFDGRGDFVSIPAESFASVDTEFSIAFLARGGADQMQNGFTFQGRDKKGTRTVGCSMPWSNGDIYFDYGPDCCNYRVTEKYSGSIEMFKGQWNLWVFTRNSVSGDVSIYYNGSLLAQKNDSVAIPDFGQFYIGAFDSKASYCYDGMIKEFRLYDRAISEAEVLGLQTSYFAYKSTAPVPGNNSLSAGVDSKLSWAGYPGVDSYRVHFGQSENPELVAEQSTTTYQPKRLEYDTTYYWRVDSVVGGEIKTGFPWRMHTEMAPVSADEIGFDEIIFVKRMQYSSDHYYTDINNGTSANRFLPGNGIFVYNLRTQTERPVVTAADMPGGKGFIGIINLSFDAKKVLFDFRQTPASGFRIWQVNVDGSGLKQISFAPADETEKANRWRKGWHTDDIHPCYLPNGKIIFSSTRNEHTVLCGGSSALVSPALHLMDADGGNVEQITKSPVSEFCPVVLDDGRVMYHRWEYIDKGARVGKTLMSMYPDGTRPQELYGMGDDTTTVYMYPQQMPGRTDNIVCVGTCHFPQGGCVGSIMLVNLQNSVRHRGPDPDEKDYRKWDDRYAVNNITPEVFVERRTEPGWYFKGEDGKFVYDKNGTSGHLFTHPWPVSDKEFMVSYKIKTGDHYKNVADAYGLYLIDIEGRRQPIYKDDKLSCWHPTPLVARKVPPVLASAINPLYAEKNEALCIVTNVYQDVSNVEPGEIKYLRVNEALPRYWSTGRRWGPSNSSAGWKAALWPRVQWGIVPVESDGSACFTVPADRAIFLQALDKDYREIQRERTYVNYRPGEIRSCVGCHGRSGQAPKSIQSRVPTALKRAPSKPGVQPCDLKENGGDGMPGQVIHYPTDIQPIFDAKCVSCHGNDKPDGDLKLTSDITAFYSTSYEQIYVKRLAGPILQEFTAIGHGERGNYNGAELPPKSLGAIKSPLIDILTKSKHEKNASEDHSKMLDKNELMIMTRWVDTNYQFYGSYYGRQHPAWQKADVKNQAYDPADFRRKATFEEAISPTAPAWHK